MMMLEIILHDLPSVFTSHFSIFIFFTRIHEMTVLVIFMLYILHICIVIVMIYFEYFDSVSKLHCASLKLAKRTTLLLLYDWIRMPRNLWKYVSKPLLYYIMTNFHIYDCYDCNIWANRMINGYQVFGTAS